MMRRCRSSRRPTVTSTSQASRPCRTVSSLRGNVSVSTGRYSRNLRVTVDQPHSFASLFAFAGKFTTAGGVSANKIAKWDKSKPATSSTGWSAVGSGPLGNSARINAISAQEPSFSSPPGSVVFAAGSWTSMNGVSASNVAQYDTGTSTWSALGTGCNGEALAVAVMFDSVAFFGGELRLVKSCMPRCRCSASSCTSRQLTSPLTQLHPFRRFTPELSPCYLSCRPQAHLPRVVVSATLARWPRGAKVHGLPWAAASTVT